jgi:multiple sugar transport system substrate-binding protein
VALPQDPKQAPDLRYGVALVPHPVGDRGTHASFAGGEILCSFKASKNPSGALRLARFLASRDAALMLARANQSVQPAVRGVESDAYYQQRPMERVLLDQLALAVPTPNHPAWLDMEAAIEDEVEKALYGKTSAAQAVKAASERIDALAKNTELSAK